ncbi:MAG: YlxM family DNA-binding protein [Clostridiales bacterium]|nr:YlxM family DNA-binding protein [Clostridiales bacterium]
MEKIGRQVFLYDFYGELLTDHQKSVYEDVVLNDLSLSEIAQERGISRQGVHDLIKRCDRILTSYEEKLHLVERFIRTRDDVTRIRELSEESFAGEQGTGTTPCEEMQEIHRIAGRILEEL